MRTRHLHDPEILPLVEALPDIAFSDALIEAIRTAFAAMEPERPPLPLGVTETEVTFSGLAGQPRGSALLFTPPGTPRAHVLHIHGGGLVMGRPEHSAAKNAQLAADLGVAVLAPRYRLAPEHVAPAALMDCLAALLHLAEMSTPERIIVTGDSAGGSLAFSTVSAAREHLPGPLALLHMVYPMLDPATGGPDGKQNKLAGETVWTAAHNQYGWGAYLKGDRAAAHVPVDVTELSGFPPVWIGTGAIDLFFDEDMDMAKRLVAAGVPLDMNVYAGAPHAFNAVPGAAVTQRFNRDYREAMERAIARMG